MNSGSGKNHTRAVVTVFALAAVIGAMIIFFQLVPADRNSVFYPPCPFRHFSGFFCPGCGSTRMFSALAHGRIGDAFRKNPLAFIMLPFLMYGILVQVFQWAGVHLPVYFMRGWMIYLLLAIIIVYWVARNVPWYPCVLLQPN